MEEAETLAVSMINTGEANGVTPTTAFLTRMDEPIGCTVGNWLEVKECIDIMRGGGQEFSEKLNRDLVTLTVVQAAQMLLQSGLFREESFEQLAVQAFAALKDGRALAKFREMVVAQGGDVSVVDDTSSSLHQASRTMKVVAQRDGYVAAIPAGTVGQVSVLLGAGRKVAGDPVDPAAGILLYTKVGQRVRDGDVIAELFTHQSVLVLQTAAARIEACVQYSDEPVEVPPIISHRVTKEKGMEAFTIPTFDF